MECMRGSGFKVVLRDKAYEYADIDELQSNRGDRIDYIRIDGNSDKALEGIEFEFSNGRAVVTCRKSEVTALAWIELNDLLVKRTPWYAKILDSNWLIFLMIALFSGQLFSKSQMLGLDIWAYLVLTVSLLGVVGQVYARNCRFLYLKKEHEVPGWFDKYGEKVVTTAVGAGVGYAVKYLTDVFGK